MYVEYIHIITKYRLISCFPPSLLLPHALVSTLRLLVFLSWSSLSEAQRLALLLLLLRPSCLATASCDTSCVVWPNPISLSALPWPWSEVHSLLPCPK